ncbi:Protein of unknown function [Bacillus mycoides]|nr:Protein of unknown function [Bacillus mycoides]
MILGGIFNILLLALLSLEW